jgi:hypothetical protein
LRDEGRVDEKKLFDNVISVKKDKKPIEEGRVPVICAPERSIEVSEERRERESGREP